MAARSARLSCAGVVLALATVALEAGGWVVITVTDPPGYLVAGKPVTLTYAVRQHGMHLLGNLTGRLANIRIATEASNVFGGGKSLEFTVPQTSSEVSNVSFR